MKNLFFVAAFACGITFGSASGAAAWNVTVTNDTPYKAYVELYVNFFFNGLYEKHDIQAGQSYVFNTKGWCPSGFTGWLQTNLIPVAPNFANTSILGHETAVGGFSAGCWDSSWKICRKRGIDRIIPRIENGDYGFCKQ